MLPNTILNACIACLYKRVPHPRIDHNFCMLRCVDYVMGFCNPLSVVFYQSLKA